MPFPASGLPNWPGGGGGHADATHTAVNQIDADWGNEVERVAESGFNGLRGASVPSAASMTLGVTTGPMVLVTGSTGPIAALGTIRADLKRLVLFSGTPTITHSGALDLPGGADIVVEAGDVALFESLGSGNWVCHYYLRKTGLAIVGGALVQSKYIATQAVVSTTLRMPWDNTIPQIGEGAQLFTLGITPKFSDSNLFLTVNAHASMSSQEYITLAMFKDAGPGSVAAIPSGFFQFGIPMTLLHSQVSGGTSLQTWTVRYGSSTATTKTAYINAATGGTGLYNGVCQAAFRIDEVRP